MIGHFKLIDFNIPFDGHKSTHQISRRNWKRLLIAHSILVDGTDPGADFQRSIASLYNGYGAMRFSIDISHICCDFIVEDRLGCRIHSGVCNGFEINLELTLCIGSRGATCELCARRRAVIPSTVVPPERKPCRAVDRVGNFCPVNGCAGIGHCFTTGLNRIIELKSLFHRIEIHVKLRAFVLFYLEVGIGGIALSGA